MHVNTFDRYQDRGSMVHALDPRVKVVATILFILSNALLPDGVWAAFLAAWGMVLVAGRASNLPAGYALKRSVIALPFALAAVTVIFTLPGETIGTWQVGGRTVTATDAGLVRFASIVARSWLSVQMAILLTAVTQFPDLLHALRHLRVPGLLVSIISFMYRYLFVMADEAMRLLRAREARSGRPGGRLRRMGLPILRRPANGSSGGSLVWRAKVAGGMVGQLFLRSFERSDRVYNAMLARGYRGQLLTMNPHVMDGRDWLAMGAAVVGIILVQVLGRVV